MVIAIINCGAAGIVIPRRIRIFFRCVTWGGCICELVGEPVGRNHTILLGKAGRLWVECHVLQESKYTRRKIGIRNRNFEIKFRVFPPTSRLVV